MKVTIPRSGLGTYLAWEVGTGKTMSPSHTVGSEQEKLEYVLDFIEENPSPSHAVGSEHGIVFALSRAEAMSPSHTVGLERRGRIHDN